MNYPVILTGAGIAAWGWFSQTWVFAAILVSLVFVNPLTSWRWDLGRKQFHRVTDVSVGLAIVLIAYGYLAGSETNPIYSVLKWSPVLFAPLLLAQIYSMRGSTPLSALFYSMREYDSPDQREIDFTLPFLLLTLTAAGAANVQSAEYFVLAAVIIGAIICNERPGNFGKFAWATIFVSAVAVSHFGHQGLVILQDYIQQKTIDLLINWSTDPFRSTTSIGQIGELKLSDKIEFYVVADKPLLLHQSSYNFYSGNVWRATKTNFKPFRNKVIEPRDNLQNLEIIQRFGSDLILALPDGTSAIRGLEDSAILRTELNAFKIVDPPAWARYQVAYSGIRQSADSRVDLYIPDQHRYWLRTVSESLELAGKSPQQVASSLVNYFQSQFFYSLYTPNESEPDRALSDFILERRAGHCEYFAIATVFLLRYSGIPARLANGYAVQEYDDSLGMYVVRRRHSHAWAIGDIAGSWKPVDTTPSQWLEMEAKNAGAYQPLSDWFYNAMFNFSQWRTQTRMVGLELAIGVIFITFLAYIGWLLYRGKRLLELKSAAGVVDDLDKNRPGLDSEFFQLERYFQGGGQARNENESILNWASRLRDKDLRSLVQLHYRYRFDPLGLSEKQREQLRSGVRQWCEKKLNV